MKPWLLSAVIAATLATMSGANAQTAQTYGQPSFVNPSAAANWILPRVDDGFDGPRSTTPAILAVAAINRMDFKSAKLILDSRVDGNSPRMSRVVSDARVKAIFGIANAGTNNLLLAKENFSDAIELDRDFLEAHAALAVINVRLGDAEAANAVLANLAAMKENCSGKCGNAKKLDRTIESVKRLIDKG